MSKHTAEDIARIARLQRMVFGACAADIPDGKCKRFAKKTATELHTILKQRLHAFHAENPPKPEGTGGKCP